MKRSNIILLLILCVAVAAAVWMIFRMEENDALPTDDPTATQAPTATPEATGFTVSATHEPTATPEPTVTASPTPEVTASPTPTPTSAPPVETSGSFRSDTDNMLNLVVKWEIIGSGVDRQLKLDAYAESYSLVTSQRTDDVLFTVNGNSSYASSGPIDLDSPADLVETLLGATIVDVGNSQEARVNVSWSFRGTYGGKDVDTITATATIPLE